MFRKMKKWHAWMCAAITMAAVCCPSQISAEENKIAVAIPVTVEVTGEGADVNEAFQVVLEGASPDSVMPEQTTLSVKQGESGQFGPMEYTVPGDYSYIVSQRAGATANITYDKTRYAVTVRVVNGENGGLATEIWAVRDGSEEKEAALIFRNEYVKETTPQTEPETKPETEPQTESETRPETEPMTEVQTEPGTEFESETDTEVQSETELLTETETQTEAETDTEIETQKNINDKKASDSTPTTGDDTPILLWVGLMAAALAVIAALAISRRKRSPKN